MLTLHDTILAGTITNGVYVSTSNGNFWRQALGFGDIVSFASVGGVVFAAQSNQNLYYSSNLPDSWIQVKTLPYLGYITDVVAVDSTVFLSWWRNITDNTFMSGVKRSSDLGQHWSDANSGLVTDKPFQTLSALDSFLFGGYTVCRSSDKGESWREVLHQDGKCYSKVGNAYFVVTSAGLYRSMDGGVNWSFVSQSPLAGSSIGAIAAHDSTLIISVARSDTLSDYVRIFISTDQGATWSPKSAGLTRQAIISLAVNDSFAFAGTTNAGVWRRPLTEMIGMDAVQTMGDQTSPMITQQGSRIFVSAQRELDVRVIDVLGRELLTKASATALEFDLANLPHGIYFIDARAGAAHELKRIAQ